MITKHELLMRIVNLEDLHYENVQKIKKLEAKVKALEKPKKEKKAK